MKMKLVTPQQISKELYKQALANFAIPCVDLVVSYKGKFLLGKRLNKPAKGKWWFPGGRILKGETLEQAVARKAREETGLKVKIRKLLDGRETMFPDSAFGPSTHTVNFVYLVTPVSLRGMKADQQHEKFQWFSKIDSSWPAYIKTQLHKAGFK